METLAEKREEFFSSVWDHSADEFQASFDERRDLNASEVKILKKIIEMLDSQNTDLDISEMLRENLSKEENKKQIEIILQICGITRNKILQDIKASAGSKRRTLRLSSHLSLASHPSTWEIAGPYLVKKLKKVLFHPHVSDPVVKMLYGINQATWPGYIRQERAKRSGHEAEYRIATLLAKLGIPFVPEEKADNPLCKDAMWREVSFDILISNLDYPVVCVKSTVHTSNIGQYGESKDHLEVDEARRVIMSLPENERPTLVAFIDGVGFESNSAGLNGVLEKADEFFQFNTLWKLAVISAKKLNKKCHIYLKDEDREKHCDFLKRYKDCLKFENCKFKGGVEAGYAYVAIAD